MMEEWKEYKLDDLTEKIVDCEHKTAPIQGVGYPSIRTPNIGKGRLLLEGVNRVSYKTYKAWNKRAIPKYPDLVLAREAPLGNISQIPKDLDVCLGQRTVLISPDLLKVNPRFLCYRILSEDIQHTMHSRGGGSTVPHLNVKEIRNLPITTPPLPTQRKIASILSAYDDLIENNLKRIKLLEEMAQITYEEWFVRMKFPGHEIAVFDEETGLPEEWKKVKIKDFVNTSSGGTPSRKKLSDYYENGTIPWIKTGELRNFLLINSEEKITELGLENSSAKIYPEKTVLLAMYGNTIGETTYLSFEV
ncbi:MAG: restriction endonuclease subunit S [Prolixibacteraceae bacterium]|jgi:type I restriction enzyme S subunit|nr:restriction endonuclease subunit S [Prolixibacteraceae bacterium]